jgi:hypothetical protein
VSRNTKGSRKVFKASKGIFQRKQKPDKYSGPTDKLNLVIDSEPSTFEMWEDVVIENDVWSVFQRPRDKSVVTSIGLMR